MMNCPRCGLSIEDAAASNCPHCRQSLVETSPSPSIDSAPIAPPPVAPRKSTSWPIIAFAVALFVVLAGGLAFALYVQDTHNHQPASGASPTSTPTPAETVVFQDPLTSDTNQWGSDDTHCFFKNHSFHIVASYICYAYNEEIGDGNIYVDAQQLTGSTSTFYGVGFRRISRGNFYEFGINSDGEWFFAKVVNDTFVDILPFQSDAAIHTGLNMLNTLLVRMKGSHFEFYVNGARVGETDDSTYPDSGFLGLFGGNSIDVAFNNFKITA